MGEAWGDDGLCFGGEEWMDSGAAMFATGFFDWDVYLGYVGSLKRIAGELLGDGEAEEGV